MTDPIPYKAVDSITGPRVERGADVIGWCDAMSDAESFARELNAAQEGELEATRAADDRCTRILALEAENARLKAVERAAREVLAANEAIPIPTLSGPWGVRVWASFQELIAALEVTDGE